MCYYAGVSHRKEAEIMPSSCILYTMREGQTRRIAAHVAAALREPGFAVTITPVWDHATRSCLNAYTATMLAASVHAGSHEPDMLQFVKEHHGALACLPIAFESVEQLSPAWQGYDLAALLVPPRGGARTAPAVHGLWAPR